VGAALSDMVVVMSALVWETGRNAPVLLPAAGRPSVPAPGVTDRRGAPTDAVQAPPRSALPQPPAATVRPKASRANSAAAGGATVTVRVAVRDIAGVPLSVTVSVIVYVPGAAYVWFAVAEPAVGAVPSPQAYECWIV
jgi:hypothetical protein